MNEVMICTTNCTLTTARIDAKSKFNTIFFKNCIDNSEICKIIVVWGITTMLATDEIVLNVFWNKLIEKENLLSKGCSGADFLQAIHNLAERYGITDEMTKNFLVYNFQKEKTQNGKKR